MPIEPQILNRREWAKDKESNDWRGKFEGTNFGTDISVIFYTTEKIGSGPVWHKHPYDEVFIVREGHAIFTVGDKTFEVSEGQIVFGPANVPHMYKNLGPNRLEMIDIHVSKIIIQENLE